AAELDSPSHCRIPQAVHVLRISWLGHAAAVRGDGPMIGIRSATTALMLAASLASVAVAQQQPPKPAAPAAPAPAKPTTTAQPAKPAPVPSNPAAAASADAHPPPPGQYGNGAAYPPPPGEKKFSLPPAKPKTTKWDPAGRPRDQPYISVPPRPAEKVKNEVSVIIGYPFKASSDA